MHRPAIQMRIPDALRDDVHDEDLVASAVAGDAGALDTLVLRHRGRIVRACAGHVGAAEAEDLAQDVLLRIVSSLDRFDGRSKFTTWMHGIVRYACIDHMRRRGRRREQPLHGRSASGRFTAPVERVPARRTGVDVRAIRAEVRTPVAAALDALPAELRAVFVQRTLEGRTFAAIAEREGIGVPTAKSRMRYAVERLRGHLGRLDGWLTAERPGLDSTAAG